MRNKTSFAALLAVSVSTSSLAFAGSIGYYSQQAPELLPPSPVAGQCYARVKIPAQYDVGSAGVLVEDSYQTVQVSQPQLVTRQENILVKEASTRYEVTQPQYQTVSEQVLISPAYDKLSVTPPTFKSVEERIATSAPHLVWKKGNPSPFNCSRLYDSRYGERWCRWSRFYKYAPIWRVKRRAVRSDL